MKSPTCSTLASAAVLALGAILLMFGLHGRQSLLAANPCNMTYSNPSFVQIATNSSLTGFTLWQHTRGKNTALLPQPVLFIHGNSGSFRQIRSFASPMHNNGTFQYFAISGGTSRAALHGSEVIKQAVFVNDALRAIMQLYKNKNVSITILAHSIGGIVARTALLLDNHPTSSSGKCLIDGIIMLGTPQKPSYPPDSTVATITTAINKAWRASYYYSCSSSPITGTVESTAVTGVGMYDCNTCIRSIPLISISGGDADLHVKSSLSHLQPTEPTLINKTIASSAPRHVSSMLKPKGGFVRYIFTRLYSLIVPSNSSMVNATVANRTIVPPTSSSGRIMLEDMTTEYWERHVELYAEPWHHSVRVSQLIGHPCDHLALVWCYELVGAVTSAMYQLRASAGYAPDFQRILPVRPTPQPIDRAVIPPLLQILSRNASFTAYSNATADREYINSVTSNRLVTLIVVYLHSHLTSILTCYCAIVLAVIATTILYPLRNSRCKNSVWELFLPENHILFGVGSQLMNSFSSLSNTILVSVFIGIAALMAYDVQFPYFYARYGPWVQWFLSYTIALILLYVMLALFSIITFPVRIVTRLLRLSNLLPRFSAKLKAVSFSATLLITILTFYLIKSKLHSSPHLWLSTSYTVLYLLLVCLCALLAVKFASSPNIVSTCTLLLYTPLLLLMLPMFHFSATLPLADSTLSPLFSTLVPDLLVYTIVALLACFHLFFTLIVSPGFHPVALFCEYFPIIDSELVGDCVHAEGGKYAIYEQCDPSEGIIHISRNLVMGDTYRVITCCCHRDATLQSSEWCDFCRCSKCGTSTKLLPSTMVDVNSTLVLFFAVLFSIIGTFFFASEYPYRVVYVTGAVAGAFCFHGVCALLQVMQ